MLVPEMWSRRVAVGGACLSTLGLFGGRNSGAWLKLVWLQHGNGREANLPDLLFGSSPHHRLLAERTASTSTSQTYNNHNIHTDNQRLSTTLSVACHLCGDAISADVKKGYRPLHNLTDGPAPPIFLLHRLFPATTLSIDPPTKLLLATRHFP